VIPPVALSTASVFPEPASAAFALAAELGYDGVELMVWTDSISQDVAAVARLADRHQVPVCAVHAPCLAVTQRVWGADPVVRIRRSVDAAATLGASVVVLHPPFRWQQRYAAVFADEIARADELGGAVLAVENMFPVRRGPLLTVPYSPGYDPTAVGYPHYTLDLSHTATAGSDALAMLDRMGDRLTHVHLADGSGGPRDEHLVPGRGAQPCAQVCERLVDSGFRGTVVVEVSTRRCRTRAERTDALHEALLFARLHLQPTAAGPAR
jgi:sugar phosphate isomerase/epimerase